MVKTYGSTIKDTPILQLQSWILGGQVVFDPCYGCRLCLGDVMYQISEYRLCPGDVMFQISAGSKKILVSFSLLKVTFDGLLDTFPPCFRSVRCQECHQRHPYPPSSELDPWRTGG